MVGKVPPPGNGPPPEKSPGPPWAEKKKEWPGVLPEKKWNPEPRVSEKKPTCS